ncbi:MAG: hypothetical protein WCW77_03805 [Patescibacteria group bacterium]|jgi:hypothetical protein
MKLKKGVKRTSLLIAVLAITPILFAFKANAFVMSSSNYRLEKDSINSGGLDQSSSDNYGLMDTVGEAGTGESQSAQFNIKAGYRQMDETYLSLTVSTDISLSPSLGGLTGGTAAGSGTWKVKTDSASGYTLTVKTNLNPAMNSATASIANYTPAADNKPDYAWSVVGLSNEFGYSPYNALSQAAKFKNDTSACSAGQTITDGACWYNLSLTPETIAYKTSMTDIAGEDTKINFKAEIKTLQPSGTYSAKVVVTAATN